MTVLFRLYRKAANERNDLAVQVRELQAELAISHAHAAHSAATIRQLEAANADLEGHLALMTSDNLDLERTNAALTAGLRWFDGSEK